MRKGVGAEVPRRAVCIGRVSRRGEGRGSRRCGGRGGACLGSVILLVQTKVLVLEFLKMLRMWCVEGLGWSWGKDGREYIRWQKIDDTQGCYVGCVMQRQ